MKIRKGDKIIVIAGKYKKETGDVLKVFPKENKVLVSGINIRTYHKKARMEGEKGEIVKKEAPIAISNVSIKDTKTNKPTRISYEIKNKKKIRIAVKSKTEVK